VLARLVAAALTVVLASVLVVTTAGVLAVVLLVRDEQAGASAVAAADVATAPAAVQRIGAAGVSTVLVRPAPVPAPVPVDAGAALAGVEAAAAAARGSVAVVVVDRAGRPLVSGGPAGEVRYSASLIKLLVVGRLLALGAGGEIVLTDRDRVLMERAIVRSDDAAMSLLWDRWDGAALVRAAAADAGLSATAPPAVAGQWGEATTTAADVATLLTRLAATFGEEPAAVLLGWMRATSATAADGFGQGFGLLAGTAGVAAKQGWMCCVDGRRQLHSAGVLPDGTVVVLLGDFPAATSWGRARAAVDTAAGALLGALG
jgi:beta-lactamase family protein